MKIIKIVSVGAIVGFLILAGHNLYFAAYPKNSTVRDAVSDFTGADLPDGAKILWARGSVINDLGRQWRMCVLFQLPPAGYAGFNISMRSTPDHRFEDIYTCPNDSRVTQVIKESQISYFGSVKWTHHAGYAVYAKSANGLMLLKMEIF